MTDQKNWYKTFFNGMAIELWHNAVSHEHTAKELKFINNETNLKPGAAILDVPCGSGRHAIGLAKLGFKVTGIDISAGNIELLNREKDNLPIRAFCADILEHSLDDKYNLALCMGNSFGYFAHEDMVAFVQKIYNALVPGAKFIINSAAIAESLLPSLKEQNQMIVGDIAFEYNNSYDEKSMLLRTEMQFRKGNQTENAVAYHYLFSLVEIENMLMGCGFKNVKAFSGFEHKVYKPGDTEAYIVAEK